jgi:hypothetical protein
MALTKPNTNQVEPHPDARKHKYFSFAKSIIRIVYIKTCKNIADIMTKQSAGPQFAQQQYRDFTLGRIDVIAAVIAAVAEIRRKIRICV